MRRLVQFLSLIALNSAWGTRSLKWLCVPVLNCHSCAVAWFACPVGVLVHFSGYHVFPFFALGAVALFAVLFGRFLCGWVCPIGLLQDVLHRIPVRKFRLPRWTRFIKYGVLALMVFAFPFIWGELTNASFCRICPAGALQATIPGWFQDGFTSLSGMTALKLGLLAVILVASTFVSRPFCGTLCPIGAILAPFNWVSFMVTRKPATACIACKKCDRLCPVDDRPAARIAAGVDPGRSPECIQCTACNRACGERSR